MWEISHDLWAWFSIKYCGLCGMVKIHLRIKASSMVLLVNPVLIVVVFKRNFELHGYGAFDGAFATLKMTNLPFQKLIVNINIYCFTK